MGETEACSLPQGPQPGVKYPIKGFDHFVQKKLSMIYLFISIIHILSWCIFHIYETT